MKNLLSLWMPIELLYITALLAPKGKQSKRTEFGKGDKFQTPWRNCSDETSSNKDKTGPEVIKLILNSAEHKISNAHNYKYNKKFSFIRAQISLECYLFFLLINVKMLTIVGILTLMSRQNFILI